MKSLDERFWDKVNKTESCWLWTASVDHNGYGRIRDGHKMRGAHRVSWEIKNGPIPEKLEIDHLCKCCCCVNPDHLEAVTKLENVRRSDAGYNTPLARRNRQKTHCPRGHSY